MPLGKSLWLLMGKTEAITSDSTEQLVEKSKFSNDSGQQITRGANSCLIRSFC